MPGPEGVLNTGAMGEVTLTRDSLRIEAPMIRGFYPGWYVNTSGSQNRDEEIFGHKPFRLIADQLTRGGIGVLRYDGRMDSEAIWLNQWIVQMSFIPSD